MPPNTVYVGRPTKWGNPFRLGVDGDREECISKYEKMLRERTLINNEYWLEPLRGKDLACWCPLDKPCHADVILKILNAERLVKAQDGTELPIKAPNDVADFMESLAKKVSKV